MTKQILLLACLCLALSPLAQAQEPPTKVGIIHIQNAIVSTADGQKAVAELQAKFDPTSKRLESMRAEITSLQEQLRKGSNTMGDERSREIAREIDQKTRTLNRATEDAQAQFQQEQEKILQDLGQRIMAVINKYSNENGYSLILDVSSPETPVLFAINSIDITQDIIKLYDAAPAQQSESSTSKSAQPAGTPATPAPGTQQP